MTSEYNIIGGLSTFGYDLNRRRSWVRTSLTLSTYSYDVADQLRSIQTGAAFTTFSYDPNGSTLVQQAGTSVTTYGWDAANRLKTIALPTGQINTETYRWDDLRVGQSSPGLVETYLYDRMGTAPLAGSGGSTNLGGGTLSAPGVWGLDATLPANGGPYGIAADQAKLLHWSYNTPTPPPSYLHIYGPHLIRVVGRQTTNQLSRSYHLDALGTMQETTNPSGVQLQNFVSDAWGNVLTGAGGDYRLNYLAGLGYWAEWTTGSGLDYVRARWLNPQTGSWLSVDPVTSEPRYSYVHNKPTSNVDPSGTGFFDYWERRIQEAVVWGEQVAFSTFLHLLQAFGLSPVDAKRLLGFIRQLGGNVLQTLASFVSFIRHGVDMLSGALRHMLNSLPRWLKKLVPEPNATENAWIAFGKWFLGFLLGTLQVLAWQGALILLTLAYPVVGLILLATMIVQLVIAVLQTGSVITGLWETFFGDVQTSIHYVQTHDNLDNWSRGVYLSYILVGGIVDVILFFLAARGAVRSVRAGLAGLSKGGFQQFNEVFTRFRENPAQMLRQYAAKAWSEEKARSEKFREGVARWFREVGMRVFEPAEEAQERKTQQERQNTRHAAERGRRNTIDKPDEISQEVYEREIANARLRTNKVSYKENQSWGGFALEIRKLIAKGLFRQPGIEPSDAWSNQTVAILKYTLDGASHFLVAMSDTQDHAERILINLFFEGPAKQGATRHDVTAIYSELEPCNRLGQRCAGFINYYFKNAEVYYSFEYTPKGIDVSYPR